MQRSLDEWRTGAGPWQPWAATVDRSRELFGHLVGLRADQVATGATVSQLLAPVAAALPDGATVLVPEIEFTSGVFPFAVHQDRGIRVRTAPLAELADAIDESTALVSFSAAQSATGEVADIAAITERADAVGAVTHMDATQAAGWLPIDGTAVDILTCHAYKWLCAPRGSTFMTLHPQWAERHPELARRLKPLAAGWYSGAAGAYYGMPLRLAEGARAFDISPAWHSWVGTAPALEVLLRVGVPAIQRHDVALANAFRAGVGLPASNSAIVSVALPEDAAGRMRAAGLRFTVMDGRVRVAFHLYTTQADVDAALAAIRG
jgi:selenocysteine lyase/cysteine desulfurase